MRTCLALAFFLARLHHDPRLAEKIIVLDDPITSQDLFRTTCTRQLIARIASQAKQVIVLSHNLSFLKHLWENCHRREVKPLYLRRDGVYSQVMEWDIEIDTRGEYYQNHAALVEYLDKGTGEPHAVARCIRLLLEEYLRLKSPSDFLKTDWLGDFIDKIRKAAPGSSLHGAQSILAELEDINGFSKKYHHGENPGADSETISDLELQGYVRRTLLVVAKF